MWNPWGFGWTLGSKFRVKVNLATSAMSGNVWNLRWNAKGLLPAQGDTPGSVFLLIVFMSFHVMFYVFWVFLFYVIVFIVYSILSFYSIYFYLLIDAVFIEFH